MKRDRAGSAAREAASPFIAALRAGPEPTVQTRLLNTADRDLAIVLSGQRPLGPASRCFKPAR